MSTWNILGIISIVVIAVYFFKGKNAVLGTLTAGIVVGLIVRVFYWAMSMPDGWTMFKKIAIVSVLLGLVFELMGKLKKRTD